MEGSLAVQTSELLAARRRRIRLYQWGLVGLFTLVGVTTLILPIGREEFRSVVLHIPYVLALAAGAVLTAWGTWLRFRLDGTTRAWLLSAAFGVLALVYIPNAFFRGGDGEPDAAGLFFGPASRLAFGVVLVIAMSPLKLPKALTNPRFTALLIVAAAAGVAYLMFQPSVVEGFLGDGPADARLTNQRIEAAALAFQCIAIVQFAVKWVKTRRRIMITWIAGVAAVAIESALMIPAEGWQLRWWVAHLGLLVSAVVFVLGTDRQMARAIDERELRLVYHPKVDLKTGRLDSVEALLRWQHPDHGLVSAGEFIPKAEETDLITPFTHWAVREATRQHREWLDEHDLRIPIAVNVSARLLRDGRLLELIKSELRTHNLGTDAITIELTESKDLETEPAAVGMLQALADLGLELAVDDFGTGYSSLSYIRNLPVKEVKLDQSFVRNMGTDENDFRIVKSTIELAQSLGNKVVAEGIEDEAVRDLLAGLGCDKGQGYYWAKPLMAADLVVWARAHEAALSPAPADPAAT